MNVKMKRNLEQLDLHMAQDGMRRGSSQCAIDTHSCISRLLFAGRLAPSGKGGRVSRLTWGRVTSRGVGGRVERNQATPPLMRCPRHRAFGRASKPEDFAYLQRRQRPVGEASQDGPKGAHSHLTNSSDSDSTPHILSHARCLWTKTNGRPISICKPPPRFFLLLAGGTPRTAVLAVTPAVVEAELQRFQREPARLARMSTASQLLFGLSEPSLHSLRSVCILCAPC
ncbi:hypothetical protein DFH09DRAFT_357167 [Mycena vulgaris]|nr:hypothetical protein DFH09DRAFT_357167 [Mycena vulgaris]